MLWAQAAFLAIFEHLFSKPAAHCNLNDLYLSGAQLNHWLAYDSADLVSPYPFLQDFLATRPSIRTKNYEGTGHERMLKSVEMIEDLVNEVNGTLGVK